MNKYAEEKPDRVDDYVPLSAFDLFARVRSSLRASLPGSIDGLGVDYRRTGTGPAPLNHAGSPANPVAESLKEVQPTPLLEMVVHSLPGRKLLREHPPLATAFQEVEYSIQQLTRIMLIKAEAIKDGLDAFPFCVGQVRGIPRGHRSEAVL
jgi:hypothetical protein